MPFALQLALRSIAGFLVQMVPCAALCLIPFAGRLRDERRTYAMAAGIVAVALVPFVAVSTLMIADDQYFLRNTAQNIVFLATVAALGALYVRRVSAPAAQKVFVISLVMCYGYFVNVVYRITSDLLALPYDDFKYYPERLLIMAIANAALFVPMAYLMRYTRRVFDAPVSTRTWWHMAALPAILIVTFLVGGVLPPLPAEQLFYSLRYAMSAMAIVLLWWALRAVRDASEHAPNRRSSRTPWRTSSTPTAPSARSSPRHAPIWRSSSGSSRKASARRQAQPRARATERHRTARRTGTEAATPQSWSPLQTMP